MPTAIYNNFSLEAKLALVRLDLSVADLANKLGRPRQTVSSVINGSTRFPQVRKQVAKSLKLPRS